LTSVGLKLRLAAPTPRSEHLCRLLRRRRALERSACSRRRLRLSAPHLCQHRHQPGALRLSSILDPGCAGGQCSASVPRRWPGHARADRGAPGPAPALRAGLPHRLCAEGRRAVHLPPGAQPAAPGAASGADRAVVWWWVRPAVCTCIWLGFIQAQALALTSTCVVGIPVHVLHLPVIVLIQAESSLRDLSGASSAGPLQRGGLVPA